MKVLVPINLSSKKELPNFSYITSMFKESIFPLVETCFHVRTPFHNHYYYYKLLFLLLLSLSLLIFIVTLTLTPTLTPFIVLIIINIKILIFFLHFFVRFLQFFKLNFQNSEIFNFFIRVRVRVIFRLTIDKERKML